MATVRALLSKYVLSFNFIILLLFAFQNASSVLIGSYTQQRYDKLGLRHLRYIPLHVLMTVEAGKLIFATVWLLFDVAAAIRAQAVEDAKPGVRSSRSGRNNEHGGIAADGDSDRHNDKEEDSLRIDGHKAHPGQQQYHHQTAVPMMAMPPGSSSSERGSRVGTFEAIVEPNNGNHRTNNHNSGHAESGGAMPPTSSSSSSLLPPPPPSSSSSSSAAAAAQHGGRSPLPSGSSGASAFMPKGFAYLSVFAKRLLDEVAIVYIRPRPVTAAAAAAAAVASYDATTTATTASAAAACGTSAASGGGSDKEKDRKKSGDTIASSRLVQTVLRCGGHPIIAAILRHTNVEALLMVVPALSYALQNTFVLDAQSKLNPLVFQITVQFRIFLIAVAMRVVMKTVINRRKWMALGMLFVGVVCGQIGAVTRTQEQQQQPQPPVSGSGGQQQRMKRTGVTASVTHGTTINSSNRMASALATAAAAAAALVSPSNNADDTTASTAAGAVAASAKLASGLTSILMACCISVLSAVYMEAIFKKRSANAFLSTRNIHLALFSMVYFGILSLMEFTAQRQRLINADIITPGTEAPVDVAGLYSQMGVPGSPLEHAVAAGNGVHGSFLLGNTFFFPTFRGYLSDYYMNFDYLTWLLVCVQAAGGLLIALIMRYSDNIMRTMATAFSIVISGVVSCFVFDAQLNGVFLFGAGLVLLAVLMYNLS